MSKTIRMFYVAVIAVFMTSSAFAQWTVNGNPEPPKHPAEKLRAQSDTAGTGTANKVAKWTDGSGTLGNSTISDTGSNVGIGTSTPVSALEVAGSIGSNNAIRITMDNANAAGFADLITFSSTGRFNGFQIAGPSVTGQQFGASQANMAKFATNGDIFAIGTISSAPTIIGTADTERVRIDAQGNVGIGTKTPTVKLDVAGDVNVSGNISAKYQDIAEWVPSGADLTPGTVVIVGEGDLDEVKPSERAYDTRVAGVVSPQPGIALGIPASGKYRIATVGRVKVKVDARTTPIKVGDLLVTSDAPGMAMKSEPVKVSGQLMHRPGTLIGKALEPLSGGVGEIRVLLSLQ